MPIVPRVRSSRILAALALIGLAITLTACVSDNSSAALVGFGPPTPTPVPTIPPTPTIPAIQRNQTAAVVAGTPISGDEYAAMAAQQSTAIAYQVAQQPGSAPPTLQQIRSAALTNL